MKILLFAGLLLVVLGIASLVVPIPRTETQSIKAGEPTSQTVAGADAFLGSYGSR